MSDSDSDVDFDIDVPTEQVRKTQRGKSPKKVPYKKARPLHPSNGNEDDSDSSPEQGVRVGSRGKPVNKRPADKAWDESSESSEDFQDALDDNSGWLFI